MTNKPAFPRPFSQWNHPTGGEAAHAQDGMTVREYAAIKALQGILANPVKTNELLIKQKHIYQSLTSEAVKFADAILKELEKTNED